MAAAIVTTTSIASWDFEQENLIQDSGRYHEAEVKSGAIKLNLVDLPKISEFGLLEIPLRHCEEQKHRHGRAGLFGEGLFVIAADKEPGRLAVYGIRQL